MVDRQKLGRITARLNDADSYYKFLRIKFFNGDTTISRTRLDLAHEEVEKLRFARNKLLNQV